MKKPYEKNIRFAVKFLEGRWILETGGEIPVAESQTAEMLVPESAVTDQDILREMRTKTVVQVLERGVKLRAYLATKTNQGISDMQLAELVDWPTYQAEIAPMAIDNWSSGPLRFFELTIGPATEKQSKDLMLREGGLWIVLKGRKVEGLKSSRFDLPECISKEPATSLNHAFTLLSEVYEPWRISHTGNVYDRFLYQEENEKWYPLSLLRDYQLSQQDQKIAYGLWQNLLEKLAPS